MSPSSLVSPERERRMYSACEVNLFFYLTLMIFCL